MKTYYFKTNYGSVKERGLCETRGQINKNISDYLKSEWENQVVKMSKYTIQIENVTYKRYIGRQQFREADNVKLCCWQSRDDLEMT